MKAVAGVTPVEIYVRMQRFLLKWILKDSGIPKLIKQNVLIAVSV